MNLAEEYIKFKKTAGPETTVDDFFDHCKVPKEQRTDFAFAALTKQALALEEKRKMKSVLEDVCPDCKGSLTSAGMPFISEEEYMEVYIGCSNCEWEATIKANVILMDVP